MVLKQDHLIIQIFSNMQCMMCVWTVYYVDIAPKQCLTPYPSTHSSCCFSQNNSYSKEGNICLWKELVYTQQHTQQPFSMLWGIISFLFHPTSTDLYWIHSAAHATIPIVKIIHFSWFAVKAKTWFASSPNFLMNLVSKNQ